MAAALLAVAAAGCGSSHASHSSSALPRDLVLEARPVGQGPRFRPPLAGAPTGTCRPRLGPRVGAHLEVFAANRVVLIASGIGTLPPRGMFAGRIVRARCYGAIVTTDPTGLLLVRPGSRLTVAAVFHAWGQPLSSTRIASFTAGSGRSVTVFVDGHRWRGAPGGVPLARHAEIVLEIGPYVPPHSSYTFTPGT